MSRAAHQRSRYFWGALLALLVAFGLRVARLEFQSLWYDEGSSIFLSRKSLAGITAGTASDIHPPLYYYFLHFWMAAAGQSEFAVRSLSVAAGVLTVALLFALGRRLGGAALGALAAALGFAAPLLVYYSQETRMYAQVTMFGLLSTYLLMRAGDLSERKGAPASAVVLAWGAYALAALACVYSQYVGAFVLAVHGLYVLALRRRALLPLLAAGAVVVLGYLPWLAVARSALAIWPSTSAFAGGPKVFSDAAFRFVFGLSADASWLTVLVTVIVAAIAAWGVVAGSRARPHERAPAEASPDLPSVPRQKVDPGGGQSARQSIGGTAASERRVDAIRGPALACLYAVVPILAMFLLGYRKPLYNPKFALIAAPGFLLLVAFGLKSLGRLRWPALGLIAAASGLALAGYYYNPAFARDNYRGVAKFIATSGRPGDAIILNAPGQEQIFPYYYRGPLPVIGLPAQRPLDSGKTNQDLAALNNQYKRLWLVLYGTNGSDPASYVEGWLASRDYEIQNTWFGDVRLTAFAVPAPGQAPNQPADATLGSFAHLSGYGFSPNPVASGDVVQLGLRWQPREAPPTNEKVFTHVIDAEGNIWAQRDSDPVGGARPTSTWKPGETIEDRYGLLVLPGTPPGNYQIELGMYDAANGKRLPVTSGGSGDRLLLAGLQVGPPTQPPSLDELQIPHARTAQVGGIRLLGYGLTLVGQDAESTHFNPGDLMHLTLFWEAGAGQPKDRTVTLSLKQGGRRVVLISRAVTPQHPTGTWRAGERYRDQYRLEAPQGMLGGADLILSVDGSSDVEISPIRLG